MLATKPIFLLAVVLLLAACASRPKLLPLLDGYPGTITTSTATVTFDIPTGWHATNTKLSKQGRYSIAPLSTPGGTIDILFGRLDPTGEATSEGQTFAYLRAVHSKTDSQVTIELVGTAHNPNFGPISIYLLKSPYFGYRLYSETVSGNVGISAEFYSQSEDDLRRHRNTYDRLVESFRIKK